VCEALLAAYGDLLIQHELFLFSVFMVRQAHHERKSDSQFMVGHYCTD